MLTLKQQDDPRFKKPEHYTGSGREALKELVRIAGLAQGGGILLVPAYIGLSAKEGSGVHDPLEESGTSYTFYKVNRDLSPDLDDLASKIKNPEVRAVLVIHYFGFPPVNFAAVLDMCRVEGKYLFEDCAHALCSTWQGKQLGTLGDASFYSIHKFLATDTGGVLRLNSLSAVDTADDMDHNALAEYARADWTKIAAARRDNYQYLQSKLGGIKPFYESLPDGVVPMNFPIWVEGLDRNEYYFKLQGLGIPTSSLYHTLIPGITEQEYPVSFEVSQHINNLPIHQSMTHADIDRMLEAVHSVLGK